MTEDHHSEYLARAVGALTPEGHRRVDELLDQLAEAVGDRRWLVLWAKARRSEADGSGAVADPGAVFTAEERSVLLAGFRRIRDQEPLDDVSDWANAVIALLQDE
jgi:hypothetical protein